MVKILKVREGLPASRPRQSLTQLDAHTEIQIVQIRGGSHSVVTKLQSKSFSLTNPPLYSTAEVDAVRTTSAGVARRNKWRPASGRQSEVLREK
jgi:hypothetical protein